MLTINLFIATGFGVVGTIITVDDAINESVEGVGVTLDETLATSADEDDDVTRILLKAGVELVTELTTDVLVDCSTIKVEALATSLDDDVDVTKKVKVGVKLEEDSVTELTTDVLVDSSSIEVETLGNILADDDLESSKLLESRVKLLDKLSLDIPWVVEEVALILEDVLVDCSSIEDEVPVTSSDDDNVIETIGVKVADKIPLGEPCIRKDVVEIVGITTNDTVGIKEVVPVDILNDDTADRTLVDSDTLVGCFSIEDETFDEGATEESTLVEDVNELVNREVLTTLRVTADRLVDSFNIEDEKLAVSMDDDDETEKQDTYEKPASSLDDDDETEDKTLGKYGNELVNGDVLTKLWGLEDVAGSANDTLTKKTETTDVTGGAADSGVDTFTIKDEKPSSSLDDDEETEDRTLVEYGKELLNPDVLTKIWSFEDVAGGDADRLVRDPFNIEDEKPAKSLDDDGTENRTLLENGNELVGRDVLTKLCSSDDVTEGTADRLVDSFNMEDEKPTSSLDDDSATEGRTLVEYGNELLEGDVPTKLWISDDVAGGVADTLADCFNIEDEKPASSVDDDSKTECMTLVEYGNELVARDVPTKLWSLEDVTGGTADRLVRDSFNIEDEKPAGSLDDDDKTEDRTLVEYGNELVRWDDVAGGAADRLVRDPFNIEDEKPAGSLDDDDKTEDRTLVEYGNELVRWDVLTKLWSFEDVTGGAADRLARDPFNIEDEKPAGSLDDDDKTENRTLVEYGNELVRWDVLNKLWSFEDVAGGAADRLVRDPFNIEDEKPAGSLDDDDKTEDRTLVEYGNELVRWDVLTKLWSFEDVAGGAADRLVRDPFNIEDEKPAGSLDDDDKTEDRTLIEYGNELVRWDVLTKLWSFEDVAGGAADRLVRDPFNIEDEKPAGSLDDDDKTEDRTLVEYGNELVWWDVLTKLWSFEDVAGGAADRLVRDPFDIEDEKPTSSLDDENEIEARTLVEYRNELVGWDVLTKLWRFEDVTGVTADGLVDSFNTEDEKPASPLDDDDETEDRTLVENRDETDVKGGAADKLARDPFNIEEERPASSLNDDEKEDGTLLEYRDELVGGDVLTKLWRFEDVTAGAADTLVRDPFNIEDETPAIPLDDDDETEDRILLENRDEIDFVRGSADTLGDCFNIEDEKPASSLDDDDETEDKTLLENRDELVGGDVLTNFWSFEDIAGGTADRLVRGSVNIEDEKRARSLDDDETECATVLEYRNELVDRKVLPKLCSVEDVAGGDADRLTKNQLVPWTTMMKQKTGHLFEYGNELVSWDVLAKRWSFEDVTGGTADRLVGVPFNIEEEKPTSSLDDEVEIEARIAEYRNELVGWDVLNKLWSSEDVREGAADTLVDSFNIEDEKPASPLDDDGETEDRTLLENRDELVGGDVLTKLWSFEDVAGGAADKLVRDLFNIEDEKPAGSLNDDDKTEDRTLVEYGNELVSWDVVTKRSSIEDVAGGTADRLVRVPFNIEDEKPASSLDDDDETEDRTRDECDNELVGWDVLTKLWRFEDVREGAADTLVDSFNIEDEKPASPLDDDDETEDRTLVENRDEIVGGAADTLVRGSVNIEDEKPARSLDDDETECTTVLEYRNELVDREVLPKLWSFEDVTGGAADKLVRVPFNIEDEKPTGSLDDDDKTEDRTLVEYGNNL
ncbi:hypothetical protein OS493_021070 [Desmophyllum pertusum]|uniref:Uncharacterized protein n=1 Tax=Desmophyllum pertusum TaxID=174260 RepID=A0A9X0DAL0_9CNID|nr:hypothetical protein OS493_021070 [Desmophyllum pertusum]